jgi:hypothetical protein
MFEAMAGNFAYTRDIQLFINEPLMTVINS